MSIALTTAAVVMAAAVVYRELKPQARRREAVVFYSDWQHLRSYDRMRSKPGARVHIVEFSDLECTACRFFHEETAADARQRFGGEISLGFVHRPLRIHRFARPAAIAAECAGAQGSFDRFVEVTFASQDSLGMIPWWELASRSGVRDSGQFARCLTDPLAAAPVDSGTALAARLAIDATPTLVVNGWRLPQASPEEVTRVIQDLLAGRRPYPDVQQARIAEGLDK